MFRTEVQPPSGDKKIACVRLGLSPIKNKTALYDKYSTTEQVFRHYALK
jgi:hypothetical protein